MRQKYISQADLEAYVDGMLGSDERSRVESFLSACPEERERLESFRQQNILLHRLYDRPDYHQPPGAHEALARQLRGKLRIQRCVSSSLRATAVAATVAVTGALGWASYEWMAPGPTPMLAFSGYGADGYVMLVDEGNSTNGQDTSSDSIAKRSAEMLSAISTKRAAMPEQAPNLEKAGFRLIGARTLPTGTGPAIQLLYRGQGEGRLTLFLRANGDFRSTVPAAVNGDKTSMIYSQFDDVAYSLVGNVDRKTLLGLAAMVSETFTMAGISASSTPPRDQPRLTPDAAPKAKQSREEMPASQGEDLDRKGSVAPEDQRRSAPSVIKTGLKPPA